MQPNFAKLKPVENQPNFTTLKPIDTTPAQQNNPSFFDNLGQGILNVGKDIIGLEQNKSTAFVPSLLRSTIGSQGLAGIAQLPGRVIDAALHPEDPNNITAGQALGTTINAGLTALSGGTGSLAKQSGLTGAKALGARVAENAALGGTYQVGQNLVDKKNVTDNLKLSTALGGALPIAGVGFQKAKSAILNKATPTAELLINSLIKPLQKDFAYGKNPAQGILKEGIVANNLDDLSQKVSGKISEVGGRIGELGQTLSQNNQISLNLTPALTPINEAIQSAAKNNNQTLFHSLNNVKTALIHDLTVGVDEKGTPAILQGNPKNLLTAGYGEAKNFLTDIAEHTRFTGNPSDDKMLNMATKRAYGITRDIMNKGADSVDAQLGTNYGPEIRDLNSRYGDLLSARSAINHRDIVLKRQNILSLADKFGIPVSVVGSMMTGFATGDWAKAGTVLAAEVGTILGARALGSAASKTRIAQFISKLAPEERQGLLNSTPILKNYYERITGQTTPEPGAPKTKTLQTVEDYMKNPKLGLSVDSKSAALATEDKVAKELSSLDTNPLTVNSKIDMTSSDTLFRLGQLKDKVNQKALTKQDIAEAIPLLKKVGIDINKDLPMPKPSKFKQNIKTGKMEGKIK